MKADKSGPRERNTASRDESFGTNAFGVQTTTSLKVLLAQELFSNFILSFTARITKVAGRTFEIEGGRGQRLRNSFLEKLSQIVLDSGLAKDIAEADLLALTPFFARGLLPAVSDADPNQTPAIVKEITRGDETMIRADERRRLEEEFGQRARTEGAGSMG